MFDLLISYVILVIQPVMSSNLTRNGIMPRITRQLEGTTSSKTVFSAMSTPGASLRDPYAVRLRPASLFPLHTGALIAWPSWWQAASLQVQSASCGEACRAGSASSSSQGRTKQQVSPGAGTNTVSSAPPLCTHRSSERHASACVCFSSCLNPSAVNCLALTRGLPLSSGSK